MNIIVEASAWRSLRDRLLAQFPDMDGDDLFDTLDGATNLTEAAVALYDSARADDDMASAARARAKEMTERAARLESRAEAKKAAIVEAMQTAGVKKIEAPTVTLSVRAVVPSVVITDESALPEWAWKETVKRAVDKKAVKDVLDDKGDCPGAMLSNGGFCLSPRVK